MADVVEVEIGGLSYKLSCPPDEKPLLMECVALVDGRMRQVKQSGKLQSVDRIAVMAALTLAKDLLTTKPGQSAGPSSAEIKARLREMSALADQALAPQEKLFD